MQEANQKNEGTNISEKNEIVSEVLDVILSDVFNQEGRSYSADSSQSILSDNSVDDKSSNLEVNSPYKVTAESTDGVEDQLSEKESASLDEKKDDDCESQDEMEVEKESSKSTISSVNLEENEQKVKQVPSSDDESIDNSNIIGNPQEITKDSEKVTTHTSNKDDVEGDQSDKEVAAKPTDNPAINTANLKEPNRTKKIDDLENKDSEKAVQQSKPVDEDSLNGSLLPEPNKNKVILAALTTILGVVFIASLISSFLGKPLCPDQKGNFISLATLGVATLVLSCSDRSKGYEPLKDVVVKPVSHENEVIA